MKLEIKWMILLLTSIAEFCFRTFVDYPSLLASNMKEYFDVDQLQINLLFAFRTLPNIVMPFVGGMLLDKYGIKQGMIGFMSIIVFGIFLCYISVLVKLFPLMLFGRFVLGLFLESCYVGIYKILSKHFKDASISISVDTSFICAGTINSTILLPYFVNNYGLNATLFICFIFCLISFICIFIAVQLEEKKDIQNLQQEQQNFSFNQLKDFSIDYYTIVISLAFCYTSYYLFSFNNVEMFRNLYNIDSSQAAFYYGIPCYMAVFISPYIGHIVDKKGDRIKLLQFTSIVLVSTFLIFFMQTSCDSTCTILPAIGQILNGLFFASYTIILWPCIGIVVQPSMTGTGFGVVYSSINITMTIFSIFVGTLVKSETVKSYENMLSLLIIMSSFGAIMNYILYYRDNKYFKSKRYVSSSPTTDIEMNLMSE